MEENKQQPDKKENKFIISPEIERHIQILRKDPKSPVFAVLSEAYRKGGLLDEAIAVATEGLRYNPNYVSGRVALARAYLDKGELDKAVEEFKKVIKSTPDNIISHRLLADIYIKKSDINSAIQELKTVLFLSPDDKEAKSLIETLSKPKPGEADRAKQPAEPPKVDKQEVKQEASQLIAEEPGLTEAKETDKTAGEQATKLQESPAELQRQEEIKQEQHIEIEAQPGMEEDNIQAKQEVQPVQPDSTAKIEESGSVTIKESLSVDQELESVFEKPLNETPSEPAREKEVEGSAEQPGSSQGSEQYFISEKQETPQEFIEVETDKRQEIKKEELESAFEELSQFTQPLSHEEPPKHEEQPGHEEQPEHEEQAVQELKIELETEQIKSQEEPSTDFEFKEQEEKVVTVQEEQRQVKAQKPIELQGEDIQTVTMADLYIKQGHLEKAYQIYKTILQKTPDNPVIRAKLIKVKKSIEAKEQEELNKKKLEELKKREPMVSQEEQSDIMKENMKRLSAWLEKIKKGG